MEIKEIIKQDAGLKYVTDSMNLMSSAGRRLMLDTPFMTDNRAIEAEWDRMTRMQKALTDDTLRQPLVDLRHCLMQLHDCQGTLALLSNHTVLSEVDLFEVKLLSHLAIQATQATAPMGISDIITLPDTKPVFELLDPDKTGIAAFYIYDTYDPRLPSLRRELLALQTSGNDPVRIGELIDQQNSIRQEVCKRLTDTLFAHCTMLSDALQQLAYADFLIAKAELSQQWHLVRPTLGNHVEYKSLFYPRLKHHNEQASLRYQPVSVSIDRSVTLITGANMAGKTVLLKTLASAQLMAQCGWFVPAEQATIVAVECVVRSIGDDQNEMNGLSSFAAEIIKISDIVKQSREKRMLIVIDEPARTTNPVEGRAIVQAIAETLSEANSFAVVTTHYSGIGNGCRRLRVKGFIEDMLTEPVSPQNISRFIDYSLVDDTADDAPHEALRIASLLGTDSRLLEAAQKHLDD
ncbi:MAG: hypothetical protein IJ761_05185 [Bacteroidales bacterium]|nr:hypothetical protein [Bacteroidales bacterium]